MSPLANAVTDTTRTATTETQLPVHENLWLRFLTSSIGMKYVMAISGLMISGFVLIHMGGNLQIFMGAEAYNKYSHGLVTNPLIWIARAGLLLFFLSHIVNGFATSIRNQKSRPVGYSVPMDRSKRASLRSKTMVFQGSVILAFLIYHLATFSLGTYYEVTYNGIVVRDIYRLVVEVFHNPVYVAWYVVSLCILIFHLSHGFSSMFQTLGLHHPRYWPAIRIFGYAYAVIVGLGFIAVPVLILFGQVE